MSRVSRQLLHGQPRFQGFFLPVPTERERERGRKENLGTRLIHGSSHGKQRGVVFSFQFDIIIGCGRTRKTKTALSRTFECPIERLFNSD